MRLLKNRLCNYSIEMTNFIEQYFTNKHMNINLTTYIDKTNNIWFKGKEIAEILGLPPSNFSSKFRQAMFINESGFYSLILSSQLPTTKQFKNGPPMMYSQV